MYDIIVIGAGPAGLTSALYALRGGKKVLILESKSYGGQILNASLIENYPGISSISGFDFSKNLYEQVNSLGATLKYETVLEVTKEKEVITKQNTYKAPVIIAALGLDNRKLNLPLEEDFLGKGISYCATCDGNFFKEKIVAVNGGGNSALEDALYLSNIAKKVYLIHRREDFRGEDYYLTKLKKKNNIEIITNATISKLNGKDKLEQITIKKENEEKTLDIDGLFVAIGKIPKNEILANVVELNKQGFVITHDEVETKTKGIFVAGDARVKELRQLTTAVSDGAIAASKALELINKGS